MPVDRDQHGRPRIQPETRVLLPDAPSSRPRSAEEGTLIGFVEYSMTGLVVDYPVISREEVPPSGMDGAPAGAVAMITELPTAHYEGREVASGHHRVRIECHADDTLDIAVSQESFEKEWFELSDGSRVEKDTLPTELRRAQSRHFFHVDPSGDFTVSSATPGVSFAHSYDTSDEVLFAYSPWSIAAQSGGKPGAEVTSDDSGRIQRVRATNDWGNTIEVVCSAWEELPVPHPASLTITEWQSQSKRVRSVTRFERLGVGMGP